MTRFAVLLLLSAVAVLSPIDARAERVLRLTMQLPLANVLGQNIQAFKDRVELASGGDIRVEIYPSAQLYKDKAVPQAVASGAIDMGLASLTRFAGTRPAVELFSLPFLFNDNAAVAEAIAPDSPVRRILDADILSTGARALWWQPFGLAITVGKRQALVEPSDLKGKKVRVYGRMLGEFVKQLGAAPVLLSGSEQFLAYQRGTVDYGMTAVGAVESRRLYEVMDYLSNTNLAAAVFVVLINDDLWRGMSEAEREIIGAAAVAVERELRAGYGAVELELLDWLRTDTDMTVVDLTAAQIADWRAQAEPIYQLYLQEAGAEGERLLTEARRLQ
ncbi:MAG: C4-dicarboxylate ABC transporter substrate-binding protein [Alphaproteobacteria bacterium]|nr:C4-dicarboxylate ABC transporter substrate-binding protein [Alphaproteobacteria bacterium]